MKARRRARHPEEHSEESLMPLSLTDEQIAERQAEVQRRWPNGPPTHGTKEYATWLNLQRTGRPYPYEDELVRLYTDSDVPVQELFRALRIDQNVLNRALKRRNLPSRMRMEVYRPKIHMLDGEELALLDDGRFVFRRDGIERPVFTSQPQPEPIAEPEREPEPEGVVIRKIEPTEVRPYRRHTLTREQQAEIIQMYGDHSVPIDEILSAYEITTSVLYRVLERHGVKARRNRQRIEAGLSGSRQMFLGEAQGAEVHEEKPVQDEAAVAMTDIVPIPPPPLQSLNGTRALKGWHLTFTTTKHVFMSAPDAVQAIQRLVEQEGEDVEVTSVQQV